MYKDIFSKWWKDGDVWMRVVEYWEQQEYPFTMHSGLSVKKEWFNNRESADCPLEDINE